VLLNFFLYAWNKYGSIKRLKKELVSYGSYYGFGLRILVFWCIRIFFIGFGFKYRLNLMWVKFSFGKFIFIYISVFWVFFFLQILEWMCMVFYRLTLMFFVFFLQKKKVFLCVAYGQYLNIFWMFFLYTKNIGSFENVFSHGFLKQFSCIYGFYNMFVKIQRVLANIPKNIKILFGGNSSIIQR